MGARLVFPAPVSVSDRIAFVAPVGIYSVSPTGKWRHVYFSLWRFAALATRIFRTGANCHNLHANPALLFDYLAQVAQVICPSVRQQLLCLLVVSLLEAQLVPCAKPLKTVATAVVGAGTGLTHCPVPPVSGGCQ